MFRYPGGKGKVKKQIFDLLKQQRLLLGEYAEFREPFLGGGAITLYCLEQRLTPKVWFNDVDPGISSIWHCAINEHYALIEKVKSYIPKVEDFWQFKDDLTKQDASDNFNCLDMAFKKIVIHQFSYSGLGVKAGSPIGGKTQIDEHGNKKKYAFDCRWSPKKIIKDIEEFHKLVQGVVVRNNTCTQLDYRDILKDEAEALIYLDPPYYEQGEALYQYFFTEEQHIEMAQMLKDSPHQWVLSYDNHPRIKELYSWASIQDLDITYSINSQSGQKSKEILITKP